MAKVIRLGIIAHPHTRQTVSQTTLLFLYNTHYCWLSIGFITLLFFWMRLQHDLAVRKQLFGKLKPGYIAAVVITFVFYYAQVLVSAVAPRSKYLADLFLLTCMLVSFLLALVFLGYTITIWKSCIQQSNVSSLFYKTSISAIITSALVFAVCVEFLVAQVTNLNTSNQYLIKHIFYETLFLFMACTIPSSFITHYYQNYWAIPKKTPSEIGLNQNFALPVAPLSASQTGIQDGAATLSASV
eukprot:Phypoly_transcript_12092.p1 GENE.Phypoly_transcript_12092~~Phypoly_transcript_12092.p1  ORF type:complete len:242 (+),score=22.11 Phypoly_transcript_12092:315-1040(+)